MTRTLLLITSAVLIAGCNDSAQMGSSENSTEKTVTQPDAPLLQARIDMTRVDPAHAKAVMHERHEGMEQVGKAMKQLKRDTGTDPMPIASIRSTAAAMDTLAKKSSSWFPAGTGPDVGKTGAKPDIWQKPDDFKAKLVAFQRAAAGLRQVTTGSDPAAVTAAFATLGKSCKACHDDYRKDMHH